MENISREWKSCWKDEYLKVMCAFANSRDGGILNIGVDDHGNNIGVPNPKDNLKDISDTTINSLGIYPIISLNEETNVITVEVSPSHWPIELRGKYYVRIGNTIHELRGRELDRLIAKKIGSSWIDMPLEGISLDQLDIAALDVFRKKALKTKILTKDDLSKSNEDLLKKLWLTDDGKFTRTAILLFHPHPDEIINGATVMISLFDGSELMYQDEISAPFILVPDIVYDLINTKYTRKYVTYDGIQRIDNAPYPEKALRECIANALMHNDYSSRIPIKIRIWDDDKMMISDTGTIPEGWTVDTLLESHASLPFNPVLARVYSYAGYVETWGRGIEHILKSYDAENDVKPEFDATPSSFSVILKNRIARMKRQSVSIPKKNDIDLDEISLSILKALDENGELSSSEIKSAINIVEDSNFTYRRITPLIKTGYVDRTLDKIHSRNQKYRISATGVSLLNKTSMGDKHDEK